MSAYLSTPILSSEPLQKRVVAWFPLVLGGLVGFAIVALFACTLIFPYLGADVAFQAGKWYVNRVDVNGTAYRDGIRSGDEVISVNRLSPDDVARGTDYIGAHYVQSLEVADAGGEPKWSSAATGPVPNGALLESIGVFVVCAAFWLVGFLCFVKRPRSKPAVFLYLMSLAVALAPMSSLAGSRGWVGTRELEVLTMVLAPWLTVRFFLEFPSEKRIKLLWQDSTWLIYLPPILLLLAYALVGHEDWAFYSWFRPLVLLNFAIGFLLALGIIAHSYFATSFARFKQQIKIIAAGAIVGILPLVTLAVLPEALGQGYLLSPEIGVVGLVALPLSLGYVTLRHRLFDIDLALSRVLSYGLLLCFFIASYVLLIWIITTTLPQLGLGWQLFLLSAFSIVAVALLTPARARIQRAVDVRLNKGRYDYGQAASAITADLTSQTELGELTHLLESRIMGFLGLGGACVVLTLEKKGLIVFAASGIYADNVAKQRQLRKWCRKLGKDDLFPNRAPLESDAAFFVPLLRGKKQIGLLVLSNKLSGSDFSVDDIYLLFTIANGASLSIENALLLQEARMRAAELDTAYHMLKEYTASLESTTKTLEQAYMSIIRTLVLAIESRNPYTKGHSERVAQLARRIGAEMELTPDELHNLEIAGRIHDIGKVGIPDSVLLKEGALEPHERAEVEIHTLKGVEIVRFLEFLRDAIPAIESHHEWYDSTGYPHGLQGDEIPLGARIIAVTDAYDAMTSSRPYRRAWTSTEAVERLEDGAGTQWDPKVVEALVRLMRLESEAT